MTNDQMYDETWGKRTASAMQSMPHVNAENFHLSTAISGLYDKPSPYPYFEYISVDGSFSLKKMLKRAYKTLRHIHRFKVQFDWNSKEDYFPPLVEFFPDADEGEKLKSINPLYIHYQGKKFNGNFYKAAEQLKNIASVVPEDTFSHVCEIGGGYGAMTEMMIKKYSPKTYCIIDLPETLNVSTMYLSSVFPGQVVHFEPGMAFKPNEKTQIILIDAKDAKALLEVAPKTSLFINSNSFAEMHPSVVKEYFALMTKFPGAYLSNTNPPRWEGEHLYAGPETYPYGDQWEFVLKKRQQIYYYKRNYQMIAKVKR